MERKTLPFSSSLLITFVAWLTFLVCLLSSCFGFSTVYAQTLNLKVVGNELAGYHVDIYEDSILRISNTEELSLQLSNFDYSVTVTIPSWKGKQWQGDTQKITLTGEQFIPELDTKLSIKVSYEVINQHVIKKQIDLFQPSMPNIYYTLKETNKPAETPLRYTSFEYDIFPGGLVHEIYPAAGFITPDQHVVGFLTDAGFKNQYTRTTRRRFQGQGHGFVGMRKLPDPALFSIASTSEQGNNIHYVQQSFGELYNLDAGQNIELPLPIKEKDSINIKKGLNFIAPFKDQRIYTISFLCKGELPVALKLFRVKNGKKTIELEHGIKYLDAFLPDTGKWTAFEGSIFVPYIEQDSVSIFLGTFKDSIGGIQIKDLKIVENNPRIEPYNILKQGDTSSKRTYIFIEPWKSHHDFMVSAQTRLAEGKQFKGSEIEKILYANLNMLTWITSADDFSPFNVPNMNYAPDMYNRDSFFSIVSTYNKKLNLDIWEAWGKTQTPKGVIGTIITPYMGSTEAKDNEATIEWLMWALVNKRRFNAVLPEEKIRKAVDFVLNEFDENRDGICESHFSLSQVDIIDYTPKTTRLAVNQGMLAIALRTIKELGYNISESYVQKAEEGYRAFYDSKRKHLLFDREYPDLISVTDLEPEFYSYWLFDRPILTDEMVINHLDQIPALNKVKNSPHPQYGTTAPILVRITKDKKGFSYLSGDYQPFGKFGASNYANGHNDGFYYNGGSWLRAEYCAYVVGKKHGWKKAIPMMENRVWAEINLNPKWPFSKEFIPTKWASTDSWWLSTRGLCWNVFILMANEVAELRTPDMDPDYIKLN